MSANAQTQTAQNILDKAAAKVQAAKGISLNFFLTQKDKLNRVVSETSGVMKIKSSKYYIKQGENEIFCNGAQIWNYNGQDEVTVAKVDNNDDELSPQQIITGFNKKDFTVKLISSAGTNYQVQLLPVDKRKNFTQVNLFISKSTNLITKASVTDKMNGVTDINFTSISLSAVVPDTQFVFDASKHPGVEVVNQ